MAALGLIGIVLYVMSLFNLNAQYVYLTDDIVMVFYTKYVRILVVVRTRIGRWGSVSNASNHNVLWKYIGMMCERRFSLFE